MQVLIIDDEPDIQGLVSFNLREAGFETEAASTAATGMARAERLRPDVIVLDLMLPDLPGTEVCRRLCAHPELGDTPILILTARGDEYDKGSASRPGPTTTW